MTPFLCIFGQTAVCPISSSSIAWIFFPSNKYAPGGISEYNVAAKLSAVHSHNNTKQKQPRWSLQFSCRFRRGCSHSGFTFFLRHNNPDQRVPSVQLPSRKRSDRARASPGCRLCRGSAFRSGQLLPDSGKSQKRHRIPDL